MMKGILTFGITFFFFTSGAYAGTSKVKVKKCVNLLKKTCGSKDYKVCMSSQPKNAPKVSKCLSLLITENKKKTVNTDGLSTSIKKLIGGSGMSADQKKCFKIAKKVCKGDEDFSSCIKKRASQFPSFCRQEEIQGVGSLKKAYRGDREMAQCTDVLVKKCDFKLPKATEKPDPKLYQAAMKKYQSCLKSQLTKQSACSKASNPKSSGATQLIQ